MNLKVTKTELREILPLRTLFLLENNFQIRYHAVHERGWSDSYVFTFDSEKIGYGSIKGKDNSNDRNTIFEFFVLPKFRSKARQLFSQLISTSQAIFIDCQSNDPMLSLMLFEFTQDIHSDVILFRDNGSFNLTVPGHSFRQRKETDSIFVHRSEPIGNYVIEFDHHIVATGGFLLHYNKSFADLFMEVHPDHRRKGVGSFLIQELRKECHKSDYMPAARCNIDNMASRFTLLKGGMTIAGFMLAGKMKR